MTHINKALDYNKLLDEQAQGRQLKKKLIFPMIVHKKYDGNYVVAEIHDDHKIFYTSGGLNYTHTDKAGHIFDGALQGFYLCERKHGEGKIGDRNRCNLTGSKDNQKSTGHSYKVFDYIGSTAYMCGKTDSKYTKRRDRLQYSGVDIDSIELGKIIESIEELEAYLDEVVAQGYEGIMGYAIDFKWEHHKTRRTTQFFKYKRRPTADLLCIGWRKGTGKYSEMIGSLHLIDSEGRKVHVGSGMSDEDRRRDPSYFEDMVIEIEYEQIVDTYIQATHPPINKGVLIRYDKSKEDIT